MQTEPANLQDYGDARVLAFGATGFIGAWLVRSVLAHGARLTIAGRSESAAATLRSWSGGTFDFLACDVCDDAVVQRTLATVRPHITFNLAGYGVNRTERDVAQAHRVNGRFVGVLCAAVGRSRDAAWPGEKIAGQLRGVPPPGAGAGAPTTPVPATQPPR